MLMADLGAIQKSNRFLRTILPSESTEGDFSINELEQPWTYTVASSNV